jgi:hypothetical protein
MTNSKQNPNFSPLKNALDQINKMNMGENGHYQYGWSENIRDKILQFYYQLIRNVDTTKMQTSNISYSLEEKYGELILNVFTSQDLSKEEKLDYITILYKLVANTRDIYNGNGEYALTHMMILKWITISDDYIELKKYKPLFEELSKQALERIVNGEIYTTYREKPLGSFKDIKYFLNYWKNNRPDAIYTNYENTNENNPVFKYCIYLLNHALALDEYKYNNKIDGLSLVSKWIPREKSKKFGWITRYLAVDYYRNHTWLNQTKEAEKKALTLYRKLVSTLNKAIDTTQIKQCGKKWSEIDFDKGVTSITMGKQKFAFANKYKNGKQKSDEVDRIQCSINFNNYVKECNSGYKKMKGKLVSIYDFVKDALSVDKDLNPEIYDTINLQWQDVFSKTTKHTNQDKDKENSDTVNRNDNFIVMVDTSLSMMNYNNIPLYNALGLGIMFAEKSKLGKRILTFSHSPSWINLDNCIDFVSKVKKLKQAHWGGNTNFYAAFNKILEAYEFMNIDPDTVEDYKLLVLSDMQIDFEDSEFISKEAMFSIITKKFHEAGMRSEYRKPYKVPTIVFWNLKQTNGFPATSIDNNVIMISGYNSILVNQFINTGIQSLENYTPWDMLVEMLNNKSYSSFSNKVIELFYKKI